MKFTGIIRPVDNVGRVVIPKEIRNRLNVRNAEDAFEIYTEDDAVILKKYQPTCIFCDTLSDCIVFEGKYICKNCIEKLEEAKNQKIDTEEPKEEN